MRIDSMRDSSRRVLVVALGVVVAGLGIFAAPAQAASWSSYLSKVPTGFESRRWYEPNTATTIKFTGCSTDQNAVRVTLAKDISLSPDTYYSTAAFTNCLKGSTYTSTGNWNAHGNANHYFSINEYLVGTTVTTVKSLTVSC
ncbi:hypothetical protein [Streptomyces sp. NPDC014734]|uniref:hypothetical protein n=1 Tax=Streptomyces sp. NPDC014734 TaxID=3364886 RepID=UPI0036F57DB4